MTLDERVETLERELARQRRRNRGMLTSAGLALLIGALAYFVMETTRTVQAQGAGGTEKVVRASEFILESASGKSLAVLSVDENAPRLRLFDENGKLRVVLDVHKLGPGLTLYDENAKPRVMLAVDKNGPSMTITDENGRNRVGLGVNKGGPGLDLFDENEILRIALALSKNGPGMRIFDENRKGRIGLFLSKDGPKLGMMGNGKASAAMMITDAPKMGLTDETGKELWSAP